MKILTLDVGGTAIKSAIIDDNNEISLYRTFPTKTPKVAERVNYIAQVIDGYDGFDVVSVATTGQVDSNERSILYRYKNDTDSRAVFPLGEILQDKTGRPTFVLNDCNAAALGEAHFGAGREHDSFLCLTYGTGVGGAIIENKQLYTGARGIAGEMGHMVTHKDGRPCNCGRFGCYEQYASTTALVRAAREAFPDIENARQIFDMPPSADIERIICEWQKEIVAGLETLTYIFNPSCIILGGGVMEQERAINGVRDIFYKNAIATFAQVQIVKAQLGNTAGMYGAAVFARQNLRR